MVNFPRNNKVLYDFIDIVVYVQLCYSRNMENYNIDSLINDDLDLVFDSNNGLCDLYAVDKEALILTSSKLICRLKANGADEVSLMRLKDISLGRVSFIPKSKTLLFRAVLLFFGSWASLVTINLPPLSIFLALVLGTAACYNIFEYLSTPPQARMTFIAGDQEMGIYCKVSLLSELHTFIDKLFDLKDSDIGKAHLEEGLIAQKDFSVSVEADDDLENLYEHSDSDSLSANEERENS